MTTLRTARLVLRRAQESDLADLHRVLSDPAAMRYWSTLPHADLATTKAWLERLLAVDPAGSVEFVVVHEGRVIGTAGGGTLPEVGYILHPDHWGKGLAFAAMRAVIDHAFTHHAIDHLKVDIDPLNQASVRLAARLGFQTTATAPRTYCVGGHWSDSVYMTLTRAGWDAGSAVMAG